MHLSHSMVSTLFPMTNERATHVHMHPDVVLPTNVRNGNERVEGAVHRRARRGAHEKWHETLRGIQTSGDRIRFGLTASSTGIGRGASPSVWPPGFAARGLRGSICHWGGKNVVVLNTQHKLAVVQKSLKDFFIFF